jgi:DNA-binding MarR family transcriptional regulator
MTKPALAADLADRMMRVAKLTKRELRAELDSLGLTLPQATVLRGLGAAGGRTSSGELCRECDMLASTATGVFDRLEQQGFIRRERDSEDRRVVWVELTAAGAELQARMPTWQEQMARAFGHLPADELRSLDDAFRRVAEELERKEGAHARNH